MSKIGIIYTRSVEQNWVEQNWIVGLDLVYRKLFDCLKALAAKLRGEVDVVEMNGLLCV